MTALWDSLVTTVPQRSTSVTPTLARITQSAYRRNPDTRAYVRTALLVSVFYTDIIVTSTRENKHVSVFANHCLMFPAKDSFFLQCSLFFTF